MCVRCMCVRACHREKVEENLHPNPCRPPPCVRGVCVLERKKRRFRGWREGCHTTTKIFLKKKIFFWHFFSHWQQALEGVAYENLFHLILLVFFQVSLPDLSSPLFSLPPPVLRGDSPLPTHSTLPPSPPSPPSLPSPPSPPSPQPSQSLTVFACGAKCVCVRARAHACMSAW